MITGRKNYFRTIFGGSTAKSCKSPGGYYIIKFLGNYFSYPVRAPFLRNLGGGALAGQGLLQEKMFGELFSGALHKNPAIAPGQLHKIMCTELFWSSFRRRGYAMPESYIRIQIQVNVHSERVIYGLKEMGLIRMCNCSSELNGKLPLGTKMLPT